MVKKSLKIGIDISKKTLDVCFKVEEIELHKQIKNTPEKIKSFVLKLQKKHGEVELFMENTGMYNCPIYTVAQELDLRIYVINPFHLKRSIGLVRGKDDKIDALRILNFAERFHDTLEPYVVPNKTVQKIKLMVSLRERVLKAKKMFAAASSEACSMTQREVHLELKKVSEKIVRDLQKRMKYVEQKLEELLKEDEQIHQNYKFATSVQGVGKILAYHLIITTNNFSQLNNPKKLACYAGVVPFDYQSGTSIYRKPRVSFMANKSLKKILHMAALRAIQLEGDMKTYYIRKVQEGKNKMSVLNAVRNKIIARVCSTVNNKKMYQVNLDLS